MTLTTTSSRPPVIALSSALALLGLRMLLYIYSLKTIPNCYTSNFVANSYIIHRYFLGFLFPPLWLCGVFYISSFQQVKKMAGIFSAVTLVLYIGYMSLIFSAPRGPGALITAPLIVAGLGLIILCGPIAMVCSFLVIHSMVY